jgi:hypothetical protein
LIVPFEHFFHARRLEIKELSRSVAIATIQFGRNLADQFGCLKYFFRRIPAYREISQQAKFADEGERAFG